VDQLVKRAVEGKLEVIDIHGFEASRLAPVSGQAPHQFEEYEVAHVPHFFRLGGVGDKVVNVVKRELVGRDEGHFI